MIKVINILLMLVLTKKKVLILALQGHLGTTYTMAKDLTANPGSAPNSALQNNVAVGAACPGFV